jgi:hypothetical protein
MGCDAMFKIAETSYYHIRGNASVYQYGNSSYDERYNNSTTEKKVYPDFYKNMQLNFIYQTGFAIPISKRLEIMPTMEIPFFTVLSLDKADYDNRKLHQTPMNRDFFKTVFYGLTLRIGNKIKNEES